MLDLNQILQAGLMTAMAVAGWFLRVLWMALQSLKDDISSLRSELPKDYVRKEDYREDIGRIHELLEKIYDKIDKKVDR